MDIKTSQLCRDPKILPKMKAKVLRRSLACVLLVQFTGEDSKNWSAMQRSLALLCTFDSNPHLTVISVIVK